MDTLKVRDARDVEAVVRAAVDGGQPLEIVGHGTRRQIGQPMATNALLDLSALNAVTSYEPNELIITVQAGAPMADVLSLIDSKNQQFSFEPMNTKLLLLPSEKIPRPSCSGLPNGMRPFSNASLKKVVKIFSISLIWILVTWTTRVTFPLCPSQTLS